MTATQSARAIEPPHRWVSDLVDRYGIALPSGGRHRYSIPEHVAKDLLAELGVAVPRGRRAEDVDDLVHASAGLTEPMVVKAWGAGLLHKSDVGAVRLNVARADVRTATTHMAAELAEHGIRPTGFLVEEQHPGGVELIVGIHRDQSFGHVVLVGLGGIATELLGLGALRVCPISRTDAEELVDAFPGAPLLRGARGNAPVDRESLVRLLLAVAGENGLASRLGPALAEFECNPVVATAEGVTALDARLIVEPEASSGTPRGHDTDFTALFAPKSIAVAGASSGKSGFGNRFLAAYRAAGWTEGLNAIHPTAREIDGVPAVASVADTPHGTDYLLVALPAERAVNVVAEAAGRVPFIQVISGGFSETGSAGRAMQDRLAEAVAGTTSRLLGPNCLGVFNPAGRQTFTLGSPRTHGHVSVISQSGGLSGDIVMAGDRRGIRFAKLASIGNAVDVGPAELLDWLVDDPDTSMIGVYLEGIRDGATLLRALRRANGRKPVVLLRGGSSAQGSRAVASHTGSLATETRVWQAVAAATGVTLVKTVEELLGSLYYLQCHPAQPSTDADGVLVIGLGGGASVLATDACDRAGLAVTPLPAEVRDQLRRLGHGAGTSLANPVEIPIGPASPPETLADALAPVFPAGKARYPDIIVHVNVAAYYNYGTSGLRPLIDALRALSERRYPARLAVVTRNLDVATTSDAELLNEFGRDAGLPLFRSFDEAAVAIAAAQRFDGRRR